MDPSIEQQEQEQDWPAKASATVVQYIETVRDKTTGPALVASRYAVYIVAIAALLFITLIVTLILLTRLLVVATAEFSFVDKNDPWLAYLIVGIIFTLIGSRIWKKKEPRKGKNT